MQTRSLLAAVLSLCAALSTTAVSGAQQSVHGASHTNFSVQFGNVASSGPLLDDRHVVYGVANPAIHRSTCVSCGQPAFTRFRVRVIIRSYQRHPTSVSISRARYLFSGPQGTQVVLDAFARSWLVYDTVDYGDRWKLFARNVDSGRVVVLDSPAMEGVPSRFLHASTDGRTAIWQGWTRIHGDTVSVIRTYEFATGIRRMLVLGGNGTDYFYGYPEVSGNRVLIVKEPANNPHSQLFMGTLSDHRLKPLTPSDQTNDEPTVSGDLAVWVHGGLSVGHTHGLVVLNLRTGRRTALRHSSAQLPRIVEGRYVVFAGDTGAGGIHVYDSQNSARWSLAFSGQVGTSVEVGGGAVLFSVQMRCVSAREMCPARFVLATLP